MKNIELFDEYYKKIKKDLDNNINEFNNILKNNKTGYLKENLELFTNLNSDGKLVRAFLITLGYKIAKNKKVEYSYPLAVAYELFQTSVLIHDDIIDNDNLRRGKETIHYHHFKNNKKYNLEDSLNLGKSLAICMGDYGFFEANKLIINNYSKDENFSRVFDYYNDVVLRTIEGELIDVYLSFDGKYKLNKTNIKDNVMLVYKLKTAYYTIIGPLSLGLILGGINNTNLESIKSFGEKIGIAFQIQDDILGIYNDMGKVVGSDIKEYKQTVLFSYTIENKKYRDELLKYYGKKNLTKKDISAVRKIFIDSGAYNYAYDLMNKLYDDAISEIDNTSWIKENEKNILKGFIEYLRNRNK